MSNLQDIAENHTERALVLLDYLDGEVVFGSPSELEKKANKIAASILMIREEIEQIHNAVHGKESQ